jgi:hypothetical protein
VKQNIEEKWNKILRKSKTDLKLHPKNPIKVHFSSIEEK